MYIPCTLYKCAHIHANIWACTHTHTSSHTIFRLLLSNTGIDSMSCHVTTWIEVNYGPWAITDKVCQLPTIQRRMICLAFIPDCFWLSTFKWPSIHCAVTSVECIHQHRSETILTQISRAIKSDLNLLVKTLTAMPLEVLKIRKTLWWWISPGDAVTFSMKARF